MLYYLLAAAVILIDMAVKKSVMSGMQPWESIPVIQDVFHLTYVQNRGAAFSMWEGQWIILIALPIIVIAAALVLIYIKRNEWSRILLIAIAFICGGGIGNLIDRMSLGYVVDLFDFRVFPVFNIADIFICVGCGLMVIELLFMERKKRGNDGK